MKGFDVEKTKRLIETQKSQETKGKTGANLLTENKEAVRAGRHNLQPALDHALLEGLFDDYAFLRVSLLYSNTKNLESVEDFDRSKCQDMSIAVVKALDYLDGRIDFWRARNPRGLNDNVIVSELSKSSHYLLKATKLSLSRSSQIPKLKASPRSAAVKETGKIA